MRGRKKSAKKRKERAPRGPRGHMAGSPLASPRRAGRLFCLRTIVCGDELAESIVFLSFRTGPKRLPRPASWGSPPPKAVPALGIHPSSVRTSAQLYRCSISSGPTADGTSSISPFARRINRAFLKMSGTDNTVARSTPRIQRFVLVLSTPSRQDVLCKSLGLDQTLSRCTFAGTSLTRKAAFSALSVSCSFPAN